MAIIITHRHCILKWHLIIENGHKICLHDKNHLSYFLSEQRSDAVKVTVTITSSPGSNDTSLGLTTNSSDQLEKSKSMSRRMSPTLRTGMAFECRWPIVKHIGWITNTQLSSCIKCVESTTHENRNINWPNLYFQHFFF